MNDPARDSETTKPPRLTIAQLVPALDAGGVEQGTLEVARALVRAGHRSLVVSAGGRLVDELLNHGSEHYQLPIGKKTPTTLSRFFPLRRWVLSQNIDILHARSRLPAWLGYAVWRSIPLSKRPRFITTVHGLNSINAYSQIMTRGEKVIAVSEAVRDFVTTAYQDMDRSKLVVIPRGVDYARFRFNYQPDGAWLRDWYQRFPMLQGKTVLTLVGRLSRLKGHHTFIDLIERLAMDDDQVVGLIVGGEQLGREAYADQLRRRATAKLDAHRIVFAGHRTDVREIMATSSMVLSLSEKPEAFGRTVAEALALGVPTVSWDRGGASEILKQLFPPGLAAADDFDALLDTCQTILKQPPPVADAQPYSTATMTDKTLALYQVMVNRPIATR